jgi:hypothetical protein
MTDKEMADMCNSSDHGAWMKRYEKRVNIGWLIFGIASMLPLICEIFFP